MDPSLNQSNGIDEREEYIRKSAMEYGYDKKVVLAYLESVKSILNCNLLDGGGDLTNWDLEELKIVIWKIIYRKFLIT